MTNATQTTKSTWDFSKRYYENNTISQFLEVYHSIDCNPVWQRLDTELALEGKNTPSKAQSIIDSIMTNQDMGTIVLFERINGEFSRASIEGGHRKRYIKQFSENAFPMHAKQKSGVGPKYWSQFTPAERERFLQYNLLFLTYQDLTDEQVGYLFRCYNSVTPVNHMEMLNSYGVSPLANAVRETPRVVPGINNRVHPLFEFSQKSASEFPVYDYLDFTNSRLAVDAQVARIYARYYDGGGPGIADENLLEKMYDSGLTQDDVKTLKKKADACFSFIEEMAVIARRQFDQSSNRKPYKKGLKLPDFIMWSRLYMWLEQEYPGFKTKDIKDYTQFWKAVEKVWSVIARTPYSDQPVELHADAKYHSGTTLGAEYRAAFRNHKDYRPGRDALKWMTDRIDFSELILRKDPKRLFTREEKQRKIIDQDWKCAISGKPITLGSSVAGHDIAHAQGGMTEYGNLVMICEDINSQMGQMSVSEYKKGLEIE